MSWMAAIQAGMGIAQTAISASQAAKLGDDQKFSVSPEMRNVYNTALERSRTGFSPAERGAHGQRMARQSNAANRMFQNAGLAGIGTAATNIMGIDAENAFAAQDASIRRQNFGDLQNAAGRIQGIQDAETQRYNNQLNMQRQALGGAMKTGTENIMGGLGFGINEAQMRSTLDQPNASPYMGGETPNWFNSTQQPSNSISNQGFNGLGTSPFGGNSQPFGMGTNNYGFGQPSTPKTTGTGTYQFGGGNSNYYQFQ